MFFFFKQKTAYDMRISDWSSDVCSSDLGATIQPVAAFAPVPYELLTGIDAQKSQLLENTRRLSSGHAAHDVLLWGARGTGKSATVSSVIGKLQAEGQDIALVQFATDRLKTLPNRKSTRLNSSH